MTTLTYEFDQEADLQDAVEHLWDRLAIGGELAVHPRSDGSFRLEIIAEKALRPASLEKMRGRRVDQ